MDLSKYNFPTVSKAGIAFLTLKAPSELVEEAKNRDLKKGKDKFDELFYSGGRVQFQEDVEGTWKENAWLFAKALMGSFEPKHEHKELVCAMIFEEVFVL